MNRAMRLTRAIGLFREGHSGEHRFYLAMATAMAAAVLLGFSRSFFLRFLFPAFAALHSPAERYFYLVHGPLCTAWFLLLMIQPYLVAHNRTALHRRLGIYGVGLAALLVVTGVLGGLIAARRSTGFVDVPVPPLKFLLHVVMLFALFGAFVTAAVVNRRRPQHHKRWMLLASICLLDAAVVRWPFELVSHELPLPYYSLKEVILFLFLTGMIAWDLHSTRTVHRVTLSGGAALVATPAIVGLLAGTQAWLATAGYVVRLLHQ